MTPLPLPQRHDIPCLTHGYAFQLLLLGDCSRRPRAEYARFGCAESVDAVTFHSTKFARPSNTQLALQQEFQPYPPPRYRNQRLTQRHSVSFSVFPHNGWPALQQVRGRRIAPLTTGAGRTSHVERIALTHNSSAPSTHASHNTSPISTMCASARHERMVPARAWEHTQNIPNFVGGRS